MAAETGNSLGLHGYDAAHFDSPPRRKSARAAGERFRIHFGGL
jgi:hypothetical protein